MIHEPEITPPPIHTLSTPERLRLMFHGMQPTPTTPKPERILTDEEKNILAKIKIFSHPSYVDLSRFHTDLLVDLKFEADRRGLKF